MRRSAAAVLCAVPLAAACMTRSEPSCTLAPGLETHTLDVDGARREYRVNIGAGAAAHDRAPLVFVWHGFGASAKAMTRVILPDRDWPEVVVVVPQGLGRTFPGFGDDERPGWQIEPGELGDRDLRFFDALVRDVSRRHCIDPARIYSTGFSNGAFFTNLLACVRGDVLAAAAPVSGGGPLSRECGAPVPVWISHGNLDNVVPIERALESARAWQSHNRCEAFLDPPTRGCVSFPGCAAEVTVCTEPRAHFWRDDLTPHVVAFLKRHRRGGA